ncbi:hypothetical protein FQN57_005137 [Myotisia sp. PD_48]|nr:hypothetical protein FQN57_005137 [Myotisia sp. PD_48]
MNQFNAFTSTANTDCASQNLDLDFRKQQIVLREPVTSFREKDLPPQKVPGVKHIRQRFIMNELWPILADLRYYRRLEEIIAQRSKRRSNKKQVDEQVDEQDGWEKSKSLLAMSPNLRLQVSRPASAIIPPQDPLPLSHLHQCQMHSLCAVPQLYTLPPLQQPQNHSQIPHPSLGHHKQQQFSSHGLLPPTTAAQAYPQPIALAPPRNRRREYASMLPGPYTSVESYPPIWTSADGLSPTTAAFVPKVPARAQVVGSQGHRVILPSVPGRVAIANSTNGTTKSKSTTIPLKDANGRFPCPRCNKTYLHVKYLKRHLLQHTGNRPYMCVLCNDTFSRSDTLKRHFQKCSLRRGNPTGISHLSHPDAHLKKAQTAGVVPKPFQVHGDVSNPLPISNGRGGATFEEASMNGVSDAFGQWAESCPFLVQSGTDSVGQLRIDLPPIKASKNSSGLDQKRPGMLPGTNGNENLDWTTMFQPKKQNKYPYNGGHGADGKKGDPEKTKPDWWPPGVIHREPDHLSKPQRLQLLIHILRNLAKSHGITADKLKEAGQEAKQKIEPQQRLEILDEIYRIRRVEESYEQGEIGANTTVSVAKREASSEPQKGHESDTNAHASSEKIGQIPRFSINQGEDGGISLVHPSKAPVLCSDRYNSPFCLPSVVEYKCNPDQPSIDYFPPERNDQLRLSYQGQLHGTMAASQLILPHVLTTHHPQNPSLDIIQHQNGLSLQYTDVASAHENLPTSQMQGPMRSVPMVREYTNVASAQNRFI